MENKITNDNVKIIATLAITIEEIKNKCEEASKNGLLLVVIDYAQLINHKTFNPFSSQILSQLDSKLEKKRKKT